LNEEQQQWRRRQTVPETILSAVRCVYLTKAKFSRVAFSFVLTAHGGKYLGALS
jgi:hypothetical protein